ncbi:MAG: sodium-dependent transporter [Woeseiaceae bacterium]|nr:sodium-dependent transporter [Woeseiaceae bacterium]NIP20775.1 sodium-dependent transporter [Woeseiaceae bacterium]NIS89568.1 sodium-dependent transporter [Woeseiaceae bacterium]
MIDTNRVQWSSRLTFVMAAVGCAVGLGNIWLFPFLAGANGGGAFVLVYLVAVAILALPILIAELMVGRRGAAGPPRAIAAVARESGRSEAWRWMGVFLGGLGALFALSFYAVAGGWALAYTFKMAAGQLQGVDASQATLAFDVLNGSPGSLLPWSMAFLALTIFISARGLHAGIEKAVKLMMPGLFVMLIGIVIYAAFVGDFGRAAQFLFAPDFGKLDSKTVLAAFGAAFFSVSVGITNMMAYGSYIDRDTKIPGTAGTVVLADTSVALLAGLMIFPLLFQYGLQPTEGPGLVFMTLPIAFGQIPGGMLIGTLFFLLLFFAALTSSIGMLEPPVSLLTDSTKLKRSSAALLSGSIGAVFAILAVLSFNVLSDLHPLDAIATFEGKNFFESFIHLVLNLMMPIGGILISIFAAWIVKAEFSRDELFEGQDTLAYKIWQVLLRFVAPLLLAFVLIDVANS